MIDYVSFKMSGISKRWQLRIFCPTYSYVKICSIVRHTFNQIDLFITVIEITLLCVIVAQPLILL